MENNIQTHIVDFTLVLRAYHSGKVDYVITKFNMTPWNDELYKEIMKNYIPQHFSKGTYYSDTTYTVSIEVYYNNSEQKIVDTITDYKMSFDLSYEDAKAESEYYEHALAEEIAHRTNLSCSFVGDDNDAYTWDFDFGTSYMKSSDYKLEFAFVNKDGVEVMRISCTNAQDFLDSVVEQIKKYQQEQPDDFLQTQKISR